MMEDVQPSHRPVSMLTARKLGTTTEPSWEPHDRPLPPTKGSAARKRPGMTGVALLRRSLLALSVLAVIGGSFAAQATEAQLATRIARSAHPIPPPHVCTPTRCLITTNQTNGIVGGWPYPILPAALLAAGLLGAAMAYRPLRRRDLNSTSTGSKRNVVTSPRPRISQLG
jgi:hypothetical protein